MIVATLVVLALVACALMAAHIRTLDQHEHEREQWAVERKQLVDRAIARHAGEVLALDREPKQKSDRDEPTIFIEGLSAW